MALIKKYITMTLEREEAKVGLKKRYTKQMQYYLKQGKPL